MSYCQHCPQMESQGMEHNFVCNCGHEHSDHVSFSGCTVRDENNAKCPCERYDQTKQRIKGETWPRTKVQLQKILVKKPLL